MRRIEESVEGKRKEPAQRIDEFEAKNLIRFINRNDTSVIRFNSRPVKFALGVLYKMNKLIRDQRTGQGMMMKRGMVTSLLHTKPDDMGMGMKSCVAVYLLESVRVLIQYKWAAIFRSEW